MESIRIIAIAMLILTGVEAITTKDTQTDKAPIISKLEVKQPMAIRATLASTDVQIANTNNVPVAQPIPVATAPVPPSGTHAQWMTAAGIPTDQQAAAERLVARESSWNVNAYNPESGSCSLVQSLPCSKIPGNWRDPVSALKWGHSYVQARYSTWQNALSHSLKNNWY